MDWQKIESAPNNDYVLVATAVGNVGEARCTETPYGWRWHWAHVDWSDYGAEQIYPTHWMPLPEPPTP